MKIVSPILGERFGGRIGKFGQSIQVKIVSPILGERFGGRIGKFGQSMEAEISMLLGQQFRRFIRDRCHQEEVTSGLHHR